MRKRSKSIAIGGITAALTVVICMAGALSVGGKLFATALCGMALLLIRRYVSGSLALCIYAASSLLLLLLPDRMTAAAYILLFGYYPLLRDQLSKRPLVIRLIVKAILLTAVGCAALFGGAALMGLWENPKFMELYPVLIGLYYAMAACYDLFLMLLTRRLESGWDEKLRKLFR